MFIRIHLVLGFNVLNFSTIKKISLCSKYFSNNLDKPTCFVQYSSISIRLIQIDPPETK